MGNLVRSGFAISTLLACIASHAADAPGTKDPAGFKRFEGSEIIRVQKSNYAPYILARGDSKIGNGFEQAETVEGELARYVYLVPMEDSSLEVFRNYEEMLTEAGLSKTFELKASDNKQPGYFAGNFFYQADPNARYRGGYDTPFDDSKNPYYLTAEGESNGRKVSVALLVVESTGLKWYYTNKGVGGPKIEIKEGQVLVGLDVVTSKAIANKMVFVTAADMSKALADKGKVDLYGIYFDTDKTDIKPESDKTLEEVAKLLKGDAALKLEVAGHTDNTGSADHNLKLSQGRAQSVVDALVKKFGIDASRLQAKGYGDTKPVAGNESEAGRAKNRRVELKRI